MTMRERISRGFLIGLVALSLILSYLIWMSPITASDQKEEPVSNNTGTQRALKSATEVFLPAKVIWHKTDEKLISARESLLNLLQSELIKGKYGTLKLVSVKDAGKYQEVLQETKGFELDYIASFLLSEYLSVYGIKLPLADNNFGRLAFDRLLVDSEKGKLYILKDDQQSIYEADAELDLSKIQEILNNTNNTYLPVKIGHEVLPHYYYVENGFSLPKYSYILGTQPYTTFTKAFFEDPENLTINDNGEELAYFNSGGENLSITNTTGHVFFTAPTRGSEESPNLFQQSFDYVAALGLQLGNLRYLDQDGQQITFTTYVEGYPLFSKNNKGQLCLKVNNQSLQLSTNVQTIQIPIPSEEEVSLEKTADLLRALKDGGVDLQQVANLEIGYEWQSLKETTQAIDLTPKWFIYYNHQWLSKDALLQEVRGGA